MLNFLKIQIKLLPNSFEVVISFSNICIEKMLIFWIFGFRPHFCRLIFSFFFQMQIIFFSQFLFNASFFLKFSKSSSSCLIKTVILKMYGIWFLIFLIGFGRFFENFIGSKKFITDFQNNGSNKKTDLSSAFLHNSLVSFYQFTFPQPLKIVWEEFSTVY